MDSINDSNSSPSLSPHTIMWLCSSCCERSGVCVPTHWVWAQPCDLLSHNGMRKRFSVSVLSLGLRRSCVFLLCLFSFCYHHTKDAWIILLIPRKGWGILSCHNQGSSTKLCSEKIPQMSKPNEMEANLVFIRNTQLTHKYASYKMIVVLSHWILGSLLHSNS